MPEPTSLRRVGRSVLAAGWILLFVTGWVVGLALLFLATGWPRWAFYVGVVLGTLVLVQVVD